MDRKAQLQTQTLTPEEFANLQEYRAILRLQSSKKDGKRLTDDIDSARNLRQRRVKPQPNSEQPLPTTNRVQDPEPIYHHPNEPNNVHGDATSTGQGCSTTSSSVPGTTAPNGGGQVYTKQHQTTDFFAPDQLDDNIRTFGAGHIAPEYDPAALPPARNWIGTSYPPAKLTPRNPHIKHFTGQHERGVNGKEHFHFVVVFHSPVRINQARELVGHPTGYLMPCRDLNASIFYVSDTAKRIPGTSLITIGQKLPGKGNDGALAQVLAKAKDGVALYDLMDEFPTVFIRYHAAIAKGTKCLHMFYLLMRNALYISLRTL